MKSMQHHIIARRILIIADILLISCFFYPLSFNGKIEVSSAFAAPDALSGVKTICAGGDYTTLSAAITDIATNGLGGPLVLELCSTYTSDSETFPLSFTAFTGSSAVNTVTIRPAADAADLIITSSTDYTIYLNGAAYVIFDGRPGGSGNAQELTISNTNTNFNTVRFLNDASNNTLQYIILQGVNPFMASAAGVVNFSTTTGSNGNDNNTIDHCDLRNGATTPAFLVFSDGTSGKKNSGNTLSNNHFYNYFHATSASAGIYLASNNTAWTITGNSFYQETTYTPSGTGSHYGILITSGDGYTITNNIIGGSQADGGGSAWTYDSSYTTTFYGIYMGLGSTITSSVQGNTIANFSLSTAAEAAYSCGVWSGICITGGAANIAGNTIGNSVGTGSVQVTSSSSATMSYGIVSTSSNNVTIENNTIGSISIYGSDTSLAPSFNGITVSNGVHTITGNLIGSLSTADSINAATASTAGQTVFGIYSDSSNITTISGNTVANLNNAVSGVAGNLIGIYTVSGINTITGNTVRNLTCAGATANVVLTGIYQFSTASGDQVVSQNEVYSLTSTTASAAASVYGIHFKAASGSASRVERNRVRNLGLHTSAAGTLIGINGTGAGTYQNNQVSLGWDAAGAAITADYQMIGIQSGSDSSYIYFNTVLIGGGPVSAATSESYPFYGAQPKLTLKNNLLINTRNFSAVSVKHSAACLSSVSGLTSDYNIYLASGEGGMSPITNGTTSYTQNTWRNYSGQDIHSIFPASLEQINLVNPDGGLDLHPQSPSVIESAGVDISGVTDDLDGQIRADHSPVDIGAYTADLTPINVPAFSYTPLSKSSNLVAPTLTMTITSSAGVNAVSGARPRFYYKRDTDANTINDNTSAAEGWKWVEASGSGDSPFSFTPDYSLLYGGGGVGDGGIVIQYFVTAQSLATTPAVGLSSGVFPVQPASVALDSTNIPLLGPVESYDVIKSFTGVITVCDSGCDYASLTLADGLFKQINDGMVVGDVTVDIRSDLTAETGANALKQWIDAGGLWSMTFQPAGGAARLVQSSGSLFALQGADRVTIDGLNTSGNSLVLRSTGTSAATIGFSNDAITNTVRNCTIEGANTNSNSGVIIFGGSSSGPNGNDNNTISHNIIQDFSGDPIVPANLIYASGTTSYPNSNNTITDNILRNFGTGTNSYGIYVFNTVNENWTIASNTIYNDATRTVTNMYGLRFGALGTNTISRNIIRDLNGYRTNYGIYLADALDTAVSRNKIALAMVGSTYAWYGIDFVGANGTAAAVTLVNNQVTISPSTGASQALYGIYDASYAGNTMNAYHNSVYIGGTAAGNATWAFVRKNSKTDTVTLKNNIFFNNRTGGSVNHFAAGNQSSASAITSDYNLFVGTGATAASFMDWGTATAGTPVDFAAWQSGSGGDSHSYTGTAAEILAADLFTDPANGDLSIKTGSGFAAPPPVSNRGVSGTGVTDDYNGNTRSTSLPDIGAFEFNVNRNGLVGPGSLAGGWGYYDELGIDSGAVTAGSDVNVVDPSIAAGATLDMGAHKLTVAGSGNAISSQQDVTGNTGFTFLGPTGLWINPGDSLPLGFTDVRIRYLPTSMTSCTTGGQTTVRRCFKIDPANASGRNATVRFYFDENTDLNGLTCANLKAYHYDGSGDWSLTGGAGGTVTCNGANSYVEVTGVTDFSSFALADPESSPTAVTFQDFNVTPHSFFALRLILAILVLFSSLLASRWIFKNTSP